MPINRLKRVTHMGPAMPAATIIQSVDWSNYGAGVYRVW